MILPLTGGEFVDADEVTLVRPDAHQRAGSGDRRRGAGRRRLALAHDLLLNIFHFHTATSSSALRRKLGTSASAAG